MHNNRINQRTLLVGIVIIISLSLFIDPILTDTLAKDKKKTNSKFSSDRSKSSNLKTYCKVGINADYSCNNYNITILGSEDKLIDNQGQLIIGKNNTGQEINNNNINSNINKTLPMKSMESINSTSITSLPSSSSFNQCKEIPGPDMSFIYSCSNK